MNERKEPIFERWVQHNLSPHSEAIAHIIYRWLQARLSSQSIEWLDSTLLKNSTLGSKRIFFARFSEVSRRIGKADLNLTATERYDALQVFPLWDPTQWRTDQVGRALLMVTFVPNSSQDYSHTLIQLLTAADVSEQVAWYQSLPLLPKAEQYKEQAIEGLRTNMKVVFDAIALRNPYPAQHFDELAWNQMVLKALFIESPLSQIQGLDDRANPTLARMLRDYAHERWAAGREVNPQLWRLIGPFADDALKDDLEKALCYPSAPTQQAAALACARAPSTKVQALLKTVPHIEQQIKAQELIWDRVSQMAP